MRKCFQVLFSITPNFSKDFSRWPFLLLIFFNAVVQGQSIIFTETMGNVSSTTTIASHEATNGFDNDSLTISAGGVSNPGDMRSTSVSSGYPGASGGANVWFSRTNGEYGFAIEDINGSGYTNLFIQFAYRKESSISLPSLAFDYWNGNLWITIAFNFSQSNNSPVGWYLSPQINLPAECQTNKLKLRWVKSGNVAVRLDDIKLYGLKIASPPPAPIVTVATNISRTGFTANWNASTGATYYIIEVASDSNFTFLLTGYPKEVGNFSSENVCGLLGSTNYFYHVCAGNANGLSQFSKFICVTTKGQSLIPGDIAIIGINCDDPDSFSFFPLVNLEAGCEIKFSDSGVKTNGFFRGGEGAVKYRTPAGGIKAGTIIAYTGVTNSDFTSCNDSIVGRSGLSLSTSGDQLIAFQDSSSTPSFLYALSTYRNIWNSEATNTNNSSLPAGLICGITAIAVGAVSSDNDNVAYNMSQTIGTRDEILSAIGDVNNWISSQTILQLPAGSFEILEPIIPDAPVALKATEIGSTNFRAKWNSVLGVSIYLLDVSPDSIFSLLLSGFPKNIYMDTTYLVTGLECNTKYYYRIRASKGIKFSPNSNVISVFTGIGIPAPTLLYPADGERNQDTSLVFKWNKQSEVDSYELQIASDITFGSIEFIYRNLNIPEIEVRTLCESSFYYWRVRAVSGELKSNWSLIRSFTTKTIKPAIPILLNPTEVIKLHQRFTLLSWTGVINSDTYNLEISDRSDFSNIVISKSDIEKTSQVVAGLESNAKYWWRVRGNNKYGNGKFSEAGTFAAIDSLNNSLDENLEMNYRLSQNFPNPFNSITTIQFTLPHRVLVKLRIYDILGKLVKGFINCELEKGVYTYFFKGENLGSGTYYYILEAGHFRDVKKFLLLK